MSLIFAKDQLTRICGNLIYNERKARRKSAIVIAELSGISQQYLSEIELGTRRLSENVMDNLCSSLGITFNSDMGTISEASALFGKCLRYIADYNYNNLATKLKELLSNKYKYSYAYSYYQCAQMINSLYIEKKRESKHVSTKRLEANPFLGIFIHFINSVTNDDISETDTGLTGVNEESEEYPILTVLLLNQKAHLLEKVHDFESALHIYEKSLKISHSQYLQTGSLSIEMNIANIYSRIGKYNDSNSIYQRVISISSELEIFPIYHACLFNYAYNKMVSGCYKECINTVKMLLGYFKKIPKEFSSVYYLLSYSFFMLGNKEEASVYCNVALSSLERGDFQYKIVYLINLSINKCVHNVETRTAVDYFNETIQNGDIGDVIIIYNLLSEALKENNEIDTAFHCSEIFGSYLADKIR